MNVLRTLAPLAAAVLLAGSAQAQTMIGGGGKAVTSFPIVISQPGSYKLAGNLNVPAGADGIVIASGVIATVDLGGFQIAGPAVCSKAGCGGAPQTTGIKLSGTATLRVFNGSVRGFGAYGIGHETQMQVGTVDAQDLIVTGNLNGIMVPTLIADRVIALNNANHGIYGVTGSVSSSMSQSNGGIGIFMNYGLVRDSRSLYNNIGFDHFSGVGQGNMSISNAQPNKVGSSTQGVNAYY